jgi:hypothetical protein
MLGALLLLALQSSPVDRAVAYLSAEVAKWRPENGCFSCHNNGDAARALYAVGREDKETTAWLTNPAIWATNRGDPVVSDKKLARIQFANALLAAAPGNQKAICEAAAIVAKDQSANGAWEIDGGSPVTYGTPLATYFSRGVLKACGSNATQVEAAAKFIRSVPLANVADAAVRLLDNAGDADARSYLLRAQTSDGGWGQYPKTPAEPFDTAIAMLALRRGEAVDKGRALLVKMQRADGAWDGTTRPPGAQSYAQHISTTAWALLALVGTAR